MSRPRTTYVITSFISGPCGDRSINLICLGDQVAVRIVDFFLQEEGDLLRTKTLFFDEPIVRIVGLDCADV